MEIICTFVCYTSHVINVRCTRGIMGSVVGITYRRIRLLRAGKTQTDHQTRDSPLRHWLWDKEQDTKIQHTWRVRIQERPLEEKRTLTSLHLFAVLRHVVRSDGPQELNVVITVVFCHLLTTGFVRSLQTGSKVMRTADTTSFAMLHLQSWIGLCLLTRVQSYPHRTPTNLNICFVNPLYMKNTHIIG